MLPFRCIGIYLLLAVVSCQSEDPRLPKQLYDEAIHLNQQGKQVEAKALMAQVAARYADNPVGQQASKDLYLMEALLRQDLQDRQRHLRSIMKRVADALYRYKAKHGEYPRHLSMLLPEYLDQEPETPWHHPFFYKPYVQLPLTEVKDRKGRVKQVVNTKLDGYQFACLGVDLRPGGEDLAADTFIVNGESWKEKTLPPLPVPQPVR
jgi:hypothetical protein